MASCFGHQGNHFFILGDMDGSLAYPTQPITGEHSEKFFSMGEVPNNIIIHKEDVGL